MVVSFSVMAHPSREKHFPYLKSKLGEDVPFAICKGKGIWENCKAAWRLHDKRAKYHCVIQDDAIIGKNFKEEAEKVILSKPGRAFSFYFGNRKKFKDMAEQGMRDGGVTMGWVSWGVAVCLPTDKIEPMIAFAERLPERYKRHDDTMIAKYLSSMQIPVFYPMPSLIDHRADEKSLMESDAGGGRHAYRFIGE